MNVRNAIKVRENKIKNVSWTDWEIGFSWENDVMQHLWALVKPLRIAISLLQGNFIKIKQ